MHAIYFVYMCYILILDFLESCWSLVRVLLETIYGHVRDICWRLVSWLIRVLKDSYFLKVLLETSWSCKRDLVDTCYMSLKRFFLFMLCYYVIVAWVKCHTKFSHCKHKLVLKVWNQVLMHFTLCQKRVYSYSTYK